MTRPISALVLLAAALLGGAADAVAAGVCTRQGNDVTCNDGRRGVWEGGAILWPDGTRSSARAHPSVIIGNGSSVHVGQGVFVGQGKGVVPLDDPNAPDKRSCAILDAVSYCY